MKLRTTIIIFLIGIFLSACNSAPASRADDWKQYENTSLGINYELPENWVSQEKDGVINITFSQDSPDGQAAADAGGSITLATASEFDGFGDPGDILELFMDFVEYGRSDLKRIGEPQEITIQELPAAKIEYQGRLREQNGDFTAAVIANGDYLALIFTFDGSGIGEHKDALERFTQSITVYAPAQP